MDRKEFEGLLNELYSEIKKSVTIKNSVNIVFIMAAKNTEQTILAEFDRMTAEIEALKAETEPIELEHECSDGVHTVHMLSTLDAGEYIFTVKENGVTIAESPLTVREPTEYEQVKAICEMSANEIREKYRCGDKGKWDLRDTAIWTDFNSLWSRSYDATTSDGFVLYSKQWCKSCCLHALELADRAT